MSNREREVYRWYGIEFWDHFEGGKDPMPELLRRAADWIERYGVEPELIFGHYPVEGYEANLVLLDRVPSEVDAHPAERWVEEAQRETERDPA